MQGRQAASATKAVSACRTARPRSCPLPSPRSCPCGTAAQLLDRRNAVLDQMQWELQACTTEE